MTNILQTALGPLVEFVWMEADLLDAKRYAEWLALWADDGKYVIPIDQDTESFEDSLNFAYDDATMRDMRVRRLSSGQSMSASHAAQTVRTVSRFVRLPDSARGDARLRCAQHLVEYKFDRHRHYVANVEWTIRSDGDKFEIVEKVVRLVNSEDALAGMSYLL